MTDAQIVAPPAQLFSSSPVLLHLTHIVKESPKNHSEEFRKPTLDLVFLQEFKDKQVTLLQRLVCRRVLSVTATVQSKRRESHVGTAHRIRPICSVMQDGLLIHSV